MSQAQKIEPPAQPAQATVTIVINNRDCLETMSVPGSEGEQMLVLMPGLNFVDTVDLRACRKNPMFDSKFETKILRSQAPEALSEYVGQPMLVQGQEVFARAPFEKLSGQEASDLVKRINAEEIIEHVLKTEGRNDIRAALAQRKTFIQTGEAPAEA